jgi:urease accessory protein
MLTARTLLRAGHWTGPAADTVSLDYDGRFLRRKRLRTDAGEDLLLDMAETVSLNQGDALQSETGDNVEVIAAAEPLLKVTGDLTRLAWHIGNRHTPCQLAADHLIIRDDHVLADMLRYLDAKTEKIVQPFTPEGGAYGHGRTHSHDLGADRDHPHGHSHKHSHGD